MATFPVNTLAFLPKGMMVDQGPADRKICTDMVVPTIVPLQHDRFIIVETDRFIPIQHRLEMRLEVRGMIDEAGFTVGIPISVPSGP
jgi:hypothetical protein